MAKGQDPNRKGRVPQPLHCYEQEVLAKSHLLDDNPASRRLANIILDLLEGQVTFFYTWDYPHHPSSGPVIMTFEDDYTPITSLARAKELAEEKKVGGYTEDTIVTTYGSYFKTARED